MDGDRREFLKRMGRAAWVVPAMQVVNMSAAAAGTTGSVVDPSAPPSTTTVPECGNPARGGWTKAVWTEAGWVWSGEWLESDCFNAEVAIKASGAALGAIIAGDRQELVVVMGANANMVETAYKSSGNDSCGQGTLSPGLKLAAFRPANGELTQIELALEFCG